MNLDAARLHILGDLLNSVGVLVAAGIVYTWPDLWMVDPICTYFFAMIVLYTTRLTFWQCLMIVLETTPGHINSDKMIKDLELIEGVKAVHDLHIWSLNNLKVCMTCHITLDGDQNGQQQRVLETADAILRKNYRIEHTCMQIELFNEEEYTHSHPHFCSNVHH